MTNPNNEKVKAWLNGRHPEFSRMSLKPGIGALSLHEIQQALETDLGCEEIAINLDVPMALNIGRKQVPLGSYLRRKLREKYGNWTEEDLQKLQEKHAHQVRDLLEDYRLITEDPSIQATQMQKNLTAQKIKNVEARFNIYKEKKSL